MRLVCISSFLPAVGESLAAVSSGATNTGVCQMAFYAPYAGQEHA